MNSTDCWPQIKQKWTTINPHRSTAQSVWTRTCEIGSPKESLSAVANTFTNTWRSANVDIMDLRNASENSQKSSQNKLWSMILHEAVEMSTLQSKYVPDESGHLVALERRSYPSDHRKCWRQSADAHLVHPPGNSDIGPQRVRIVVLTRYTTTNSVRAGVSLNRQLTIANWRGFRFRTVLRYSRPGGM